MATLDMRARACRCIAAVVLSLVVLGARAEEPSQRDLRPEDDQRAAKVGELGDSDRIHVSGCESFSQEEIRRGLRRSFFYQAAARPGSTLETLLLASRHCVEQGYHNSGFVDVTVTAAYDGERQCVAIAIDEGRQYMTGKIVVKGAATLDSHELVRCLQEPAPPRAWRYVRGDLEPPNADSDGDQALWQPGKPLKIDRARVQTVGRRLARLLAEFGRPFAECDVNIVPDRARGVGDLVITIHEERDAAVVNDVRITGLTRHRREQVLNYLDLKPGDALDAGRVDAIREALRQSCRFWKYDVRVRLIPPKKDRYTQSPGAVVLEIDLLEYEHAPPLDQPLPEADACLVRFAAWLQRFQQGATEHEILIRVDVDDVGTLEMVVAPQRGAVAQLAAASNAVALDVGVVDRKDHIEAFDWRTNKKLRGPVEWRPSLSFSFVPRAIEDGHYRGSLNVGLGLTNKKQAAERAIWTGSIEPVAAVHCAHRRTARMALEEGVLTILDQNLTLRIDQSTGALLDAQWKGDSHASIEVTRGQFDRLQADIESRGANLQPCFDAAAPFASTIAFAASSLAEHPWIAREKGMALLCRSMASRLAKPAEAERLEKLINAFGINNGHAVESKFCIPNEAVSQIDLTRLGLGRQTLITMPGVADFLFPEHSLPWTLLREFAFQRTQPPLATVFQGGTADELIRVLSGPETGPLGAFLAARFLETFATRPAGQVVNKFREIVNEADIERDMAWLVVGEHAFATFVRDAIQYSDLLDDEQQAAVLQALPAELRPTLGRLFERRRTVRDESPENTVRAVLEEAWRSELRDYVHAELDRMAGPGAVAAQGPTPTAAR